MRTEIFKHKFNLIITYIKLILEEIINLKSTRMGWIINRDMKILVLLTFIFSTFSTVFAEGHKKYKEEDCDKIKLMKIEYLNKKINCVKASNDFKEMKKCWKKRKNKMM